MMDLINKKYRLHAVVTLLLVLGILFLNRALFPPDGFALGAHDTRGLFIPWINFVRSSLENGRLPLWNPYEFVGYPFLSNPQVGFFYPFAWLTFLLPANMGLSWYMLVHLWIAAVGMFLYVRFLGGGWLGSLISAVIFGFSGFVAARIWAGHFGVVATFSWLPWVLLSLKWSVNTKSIWSAIIAGVPISLSFLAGHTPSFIYVLLIWMAFAGYLVVGEKHALTRVLRQAIVALIVGIGLASIQLIPFIELVLNSPRLSGIDYNFASQFSFPPAHLLTLLLPELFGEPVRSGYWSVPSFEELTYYASVIAIIGLVLGLRRPTRLTWFYLILMFVGLWLAMGSYSGLYNILYGVFPPIRMMRAPARSAVLYLFASAALIGHAISVWESASMIDRRQSLASLLKWLLAILVVALLATIGATAAIFLSVHPTETSGRLWHQLGAYSFALLMILLMGGLIWAYLSIGPAQSNKKIYIAAALIIVVLADLWQFGTKLIRLNPVDNFALWEQSDQLLEEPYTRILPWGLSIFEQNGATENLMPSVFGYQALEPAKLIDLATNVVDPRAGAYDVLSASHVVASTPLEQFTEGDKGLELVSSSSNSWVYRRPLSQPLARLVYREEIIAQQTEAIARINSADFDPGNLVIVDAASDCSLEPIHDPDDKVIIESTVPGYWRIQTESDQSSLLVLAESNYPGWRPTIDGAPAQPLTAYTILKAVCVPPGAHTVEWRYQPSSFLIGGVISSVFLALATFAIFKQLRKKEEIHQEENQV
jgi:hypothetical protein